MEGPMPNGTSNYFANYKRIFKAFCIWKHLLDLESKINTKILKTQKF